MRPQRNRVPFVSSLGGFPRGRPAIELPEASCPSRGPFPFQGYRWAVDGEAAVQCSAKGCRAAAVWQLRWNNPKLHAPDYRKTWLACDDHRESLGGFLEARGFLRAVERFDAAADAGIP
jgi:hypothetical protein